MTFYSVDMMMIIRIHESIFPILLPLMSVFLLQHVLDRTVFWPWHHYSQPTGRAAAATGSVPGLKRMMARRQPSSVLSICMSLILLTSSVRTLAREEQREREDISQVEGENARPRRRDGMNVCQ